MGRYVSREARRKWNEELEVLEYGEIEKKCDEIITTIQAMQLDDECSGGKESKDGVV